MDNENNLFILAGNGPYDNRGCEAIVRGTTEILRTHYKSPSFLNVSHFKTNEQFEKQCSDEIDSSIIHKKTYNSNKIFSLEGFHNNMLKVVSTSQYKKAIYKEMFPDIINAKAVLSLGGDNYSLDYGIPKMFTYLDDIVLKYNKPLIIWGASVGPFEKNPEYEKYMVEHLKKITGIFVRESYSLKYLQDKGLIDNVFKVADPAFLMEPIKPKEIEIEEGAIGINFSPLMAKYTTGGDVQEWIRMASNIILAISKKTSRKIYLIPHVTNPNSNDFYFLSEVTKLINIDDCNISLIPPIYNAAEIKWVISKMHIFAGARTHSTIAALSSNVPTLSFGYSIKAKGINSDIFGNNQFCVEPHDLNPDAVTNKIVELIDNHKNIKNILSYRMPDIKKEALIAGKYVQNLVEQ